jgi:sigma-B regulation protein RsbU (phosphoserine phosphatase)
MDDGYETEHSDGYRGSTQMRDINEQLVIASVHLQELAEFALQTEQRLRDLVDGLNVVICEVDAKTGKALFISLRSKSFLGGSHEKWITAANFLTEIAHPDDRDRVADRLKALFEHGYNSEYDFRAISGDSYPIYLRNIVRSVRGADGTLELLRCVIVDITQERATQQALEATSARERDITEKLQRSILLIPPQDSFPGITFSRFYRSASEESFVGGDFADAFAFDGGHVAFILGDVMGHGLPAAMLTAELKFALRGFVREHVHPGRILNQMNSYLCESFRLHREGLNEAGNEWPLCLTLVIIEPKTGNGSAACAGMEPPLLVRNDGKAEELEVGGMLLGVLSDADYEETEFHLEKGDTILFSTDGITESRHGMSFLGHEGLRKLAVASSSSETLEEMGRSIVDGARKYSGGILTDDVCLLLARRQ